MINNQLVIFIGQNQVLLEISAYDDYFTFEVVNPDLPGFDVLTFFDLKLNYDYNASDSFLAAGIAMNLHTHHVFYPSGESKEVIGQCTSHTGLTGAKLAVVACKKLCYGISFAKFIVHFLRTVSLSFYPVEDLFLHTVSQTDTIVY